MGIVSEGTEGPIKAELYLRGSLVLFSYRWIYGLEEFSVSSNIQRGCKDYQGVIHNTYHGENIETDHHVIVSMP